MSCETITYMLIIVASSLIIWYVIKWLTKIRLVDFCITEMTCNTLPDYKQQSDSEEFKMKISGLINFLIFLGFLCFVSVVFYFLTNVDMKNLIYILGLYFKKKLGFFRLL